MDLTETAQNAWTAQREAAFHSGELSSLLSAISDATTAILAASTIISKTITTHQPQVTVNNPVESVATPDMAKVVAAIDKLAKIEQKPEDFKPVVNELKKLLPALQAIPKAIILPEAPESVTVKNLSEVSSELGDIKKLLGKALSREIPAPSVTVEPTPVTVQEREVDLTPLLAALETGLGEVRQAIAGIPVDDDTAVLEATRSVTDAIQGLRFPVPNVITDPLIKFKVADLDDAGSVKYFGQIANDGSWVIMKEDDSVSPKTIRYASGSGSYPTNWTDRAILSYSYLYEAING